uniref:Uncharacterized protein n=1 Tax=Oryza rufipogon TaxID=4529 RepID=A0A0E0NMA7_ORYRU
MESSDWAELLEDVLLTIMERLDIPDLIRSSAVCASWCAASSAVRRARFPLPSSAKQLPCLFYACEAYSPNNAVVHCPFTGESIQVPFLLGVVTEHSVVGVGHGWIVTADEVSNLRLINPITGAQACLPPITGIHHVEKSFTGAGNNGALMYNVFVSSTPGLDPEPLLLTANEARECMYHRVVLSCSPSTGEGACVALLAHMECGELSFAQPGDERWTWVSLDKHPCFGGFEDFFHNDDDGLFYALCIDGSIYTLDLNGDSPIVRQITGKVPQRWYPSTMYLLREPWGDILQVRRWRSYVDLMATSSSEHPNNLEVDDDDDDLDPIVGINDDIYPYLELKTTDIEVFKVDFDRKKLVKMKSLDDHALFLGYNSTMCISTKDYPMLKPNCAYITDDSSEYVYMYKNSWREIGIWDMKSKSLQSFACTENSPPWLNWPFPVWIKPSLF